MAVWDAFRPRMQATTSTNPFQAPPKRAQR
jgi:hypothetical protein